MKKDEYIGVLPDNRPKEEQARDWRAEEVAGASTMTPKFRTVKKGKWKKYTVRDQDGSGSCVSQALAKGFEVLYKIETGKTVVFSSVPIYQKRKNAPAGGMFIHDAFDIAVKSGTCPEVNCASQKKNDVQMDGTTIPSNFENLNNYLDALAYVSLPEDFDYIASWVEQYGFAQIHIASSRKCWSKDFPSLGSLNRSVRHAVAVVDAVTYEKVQYLVIEDSWGEFGEFKGQRLLSRAVFKDMFTKGAGFTALKYDVSDVFVFMTFTVPMEYGDTSAEVQNLQRFLRGKGYFPSNVDITGYYGEITAKAVLAWQTAMKVDTEKELNFLKGHFFGPKSIKIANQSS